MVASSFTSNFTNMTSGHEIIGQESLPFSFPYYSTNQVNSVNSNSNSMYRCTIPQLVNHQPSPLNSSMTSGHEIIGQESLPFSFPYYSTNQVNSVNSNSNSMYRCTIPQLVNHQPSPLNSSICRRNAIGIKRRKRFRTSYLFTYLLVYLFDLSESEQKLNELLN
ncbi:unnamed protein product [Brugia pahangi]|uniref:Uncharacterized protein n=1 Tax=Brugia pahangi TaxID=6280 RepID=A0A0N4T913_BRUPA|nr:unnamed protein product [Brugia pahangi]